MVKGFWERLKKPIIGLAPMDGVTDAAFRYIVDKYGKPDVLFTEFTSVEGISYGASQLLNAFIYHQTETPTVAQIFGSDPEAFYKVSLVIAEMGFDGIDINMGCPDHHIAKKGGGAGLILKPQLAQEIIKATKRGVEDWANGRSMLDVGLKPAIIDWVNEFKKRSQFTVHRSQIPVSIKTRVGYEEIVTEQWISNLLEVEPVAITIHGRTLKQLYSGLSNWDEIAKAAKLVKKTETIILGNGDVKSLDEAKEKIKTYGVDGVLVGRASFGNPWIFKNEVVDLPKKLHVALEHAKAFQELTPNLHFLSLRKHLAWYCKGFEGASEVRVKLLQVNNAQDIKNILQPFLT